MKLVTFTEKELGIVRNLFQSELNQVENYIETVMEILLKLKGFRESNGSATVAVEVKVAKKRGRKPKPVDKVAQEPRVPEKRGRKPGTAIRVQALNDELKEVESKEQGSVFNEPEPRKNSSKLLETSPVLRPLPDISNTKFGHGETTPPFGVPRVKKAPKKSRRRKKGKSSGYSRDIILSPMSRSRQPVSPRAEDSDPEINADPVEMVIMKTIAAEPAYAGPMEFVAPDKEEPQPAFDTDI